MNQFHVGQQVVCIDDKFDRVTIPQGITKGQTYVLRWVGMFKSYVDGEFLGVKLEGVERGTCPTYGEVDPPFAARRFRPLVNNPLEFLRQVGAGLPIQGDEGPVRGAPLPDDDGGEVKEKELEEVA